MHIIEYIKKECTDLSMGSLEDLAGCTINRDLDRMTLNISWYHLITKMNQGFNNDMKSLITLNTPVTPYEGIIRKQETGTKSSKDIPYTRKRIMGKFYYYGISTIRHQNKNP